MSFVMVVPVNHCKGGGSAPRTRGARRVHRRRGWGAATHDEVALLAGAIVDLDVARLGLVRDAGDVDGLLAGGDRVRDCVGLGSLCRGLLLDAATNIEHLEVEADVCARGDALRDLGRAAEGDGDVFGGAAAAVSCGW